MWHCHMSIRIQSCLSSQYSHILKICQKSNARCGILIEPSTMSLVCLVSLSDGGVEHVWKSK